MPSAIEKILNLEKSKLSLALFSNHRRESQTNSENILAPFQRCAMKLPWKKAIVFKVAIYKPPMIGGGLSNWPNVLNCLRNLVQNAKLVENQPKPSKTSSLLDVDF